ncbi:hypothetical protein Tco_0152972 [Tanacetum coccineum]
MRPSLDERNPDMVHKVVCIGCRTRFNGENMPIKASKKHSIGKLHQVIFDHTSHSLGHVIGEVESFNGVAFVGRSFVEDGVMHHIEIIQGSQIEGIRIDAIWKGYDGPLRKEHAYTFIWNTNRKDLADVRVIEKEGVDDTTFVEEASLEILKSGFFLGFKTWSLIIFWNVKSGVLVVDMDGFRHLEPKEIISPKNVKG